MFAAVVAFDVPLYSFIEPKYWSWILFD